MGCVPQLKITNLQCHAGKNISPFFVIDAIENLLARLKNIVGSSFLKKFKPSNVNVLFVSVVHVVPLPIRTTALVRKLVLLSVSSVFTIQNESLIQNFNID